MPNMTVSPLRCELGMSNALIVPPPRQLTSPPLSSASVVMAQVDSTQPPAPSPLDFLLLPTLIELPQLLHPAKLFLFPLSSRPPVYRPIRDDFPFSGLAPTICEAILTTFGPKRDGESLLIFAVECEGYGTLTPDALDENGVQLRLMADQIKGKEVIGICHPRMLQNATALSLALATSSILSGDISFHLSSASITTSSNISYSSHLQLHTASSSAAPHPPSDPTPTPDRPIGLLNASGVSARPGASIGFAGEAHGSGTLGCWLQCGAGRLLGLTNGDVLPSYGAEVVFPSEEDRQYFARKYIPQGSDDPVKASEYLAEREALGRKSPLGVVLYSRLSYEPYPADNDDPPETWSSQIKRRLDVAVFDSSLSPVLSDLNLANMCRLGDFTVRPRFTPPRHLAEVSMRGRSSGEIFGLVSGPKKALASYGGDKAGHRCWVWMAFGRGQSTLCQKGDSGAVLIDDEYNGVCGLLHGECDGHALFTDINWVMEELKKEDGFQDLQLGMARKDDNGLN